MRKLSDPKRHSSTLPLPAAVITGTSGVDALFGTQGDDEILGLGGNDFLYGLNGNDFLDGGTGDDTMDGGNDNDTYFVDSAGDVVIEGFTSNGYDSVYTTVSYSLIPTSMSSNGEPVVEILAALNQAGTDAINLFGNIHPNWLWGTNGANYLSGGGGDDVLDAFGGDDALDGGTGSDYLSGGEGNDSLVGGELNDVMVGGNGNDMLDGRVTTNTIYVDSDTLYGAAGDDIYFVDYNGDVVVEDAGQGFDIVYTNGTYALSAGSEVEILAGIGDLAMELRGNELNNTLWGNNAALNTLIGGAGNDVLMGLGGGDMLIGDEGSDYLDGGTGFGQQFGGAGADSFVFSTMNGYPTIEDFTGGTDKLLFYSNVYTGLAPGALPASAFQTGTAFGPGSFQDTDDRFFYDTTSRQLYYDPDGSGAAGATIVAVLQSGAVLIASDFVIY